MRDMQDWFGTIGSNGITEIVSEDMSNVYATENIELKDELKDMKLDMIEVLLAIKEDRPDLVHKFMKYLKVEES